MLTTKFKVSVELYSGCTQFSQVCTRRLLLTLNYATQERCTALRNLPRLPYVDLQLVLEEFPEDVQQRLENLAKLETMELNEDRDYVLTVCLIALFGW